MSIRLAVGCALVVFLLSVATIIAVGLAQPVHGTTINQAPAEISGPAMDVGQIKRDFLASPSVIPGNQTQPSAQPQSAPPAPNVTADPAPAVAPAPVTPPTPVIAPDPPPVADPQPPVYHRRTRAS
ncbi:MAG: hypothetical protein U0R44_01695 [Candidatus Micrarchaeia archaeon]